MGPAERSRWLKQQQDTKNQMIERNKQEALAKRARKEAEKLSGEAVAA
jgi:predicted Fe-S protein YdhL (DUF1289 family)